MSGSEAADVPRGTESVSVARDPRSLFRALLAVRKLVGALEREVRVVAWPPGEGDGGPDRRNRLEEILALAQEAYSLGNLRLSEAKPHELDSFEQVVSEKLALGRWLAAPELLESEHPDARRRMRQWLAEVAEEAPVAVFGGEMIRAPDGAHLPVYAGGASSAAPIALVLPCGMPIELSEMWLRRLASRQRVVAWETRGLFGRQDDFDAIGTDLDTQANDLFAVMDHHGIGRSHVVGLCSGAVVAMRAAALQPERVSSLSLWNGDYYGLGEDCPRTPYQKGFAALTAMVAGDRRRATLVQRRFLQPAAVAGVDRTWAHLTLYPYADAGLLHAFGRLNLPVIESELAAWVGEVRVPTLVVTSETDERAHPEGSRRMARALPRGQLHSEPEGDHLSVLTVHAHLVDLATRFSERCRA
jgi:pimeloyl-ACP methyl ester carboxylesterase